MMREENANSRIKMSLSIVKAQVEVSQSKNALRRSMQDSDSSRRMESVVTQVNVRMNATVCLTADMMKRSPSIRTSA
jgi:hypothetical protein